MKADSVAHSVSTERRVSRFSIKYRAACDCGFRGRTTTLNLAQQEARWHRDAARAVGAMTKGARAMADHACDQCGGTKEVRYMPDPECGGVHAWYACVDCRGRTGSGGEGDHAD